jgi:hypothetical protein
MAKQTLYITGTVGLTYVHHPMLAYSEVMLCLREGKMRVETSDEPLGKRFKHNSAAARVEFPSDQPIFGDPTGTTDIAAEEFIIEVKY